MLTESFLLPFRMSIAEKGLHIYGVHVYQEGEGSVCHRIRRDEQTNLYSCSKAFTSMAIGICQDEGRLALSDRLLDFFPEYRGIASEGTERITIRDMLHMASGKRENDFGTAPYPPRLLERDWAELYMEAPLCWEPGTHFHYYNLNTYMLGRIVERVSGDILAKYLTPRLFEPLGIFNPQWHTDPRGHSTAACDLFLNTEQLSRLGRMMLDQGTYGEKQVVGAAYLEAAVNDCIENSHFNPMDGQCMAGYGYQLWRCMHPGSYRADGMYGQYTIVVPDKRAVVTVNSHEEMNANAIIHTIFSEIVDRL